MAFPKAIGQKLPLYNAQRKQPAEAARKWEQRHPKAAPKAAVFGGRCSCNPQFIDKENAVSRLNLPLSEQLQQPHFLKTTMLWKLYNRRSRALNRAALLTKSRFTNPNLAHFPEVNYIPARTMSGIESKNCLNGPTGEHSAWAGPGPAAFDFRSDVVTTPTPSMLAAIQNTTLLDDVFMEDPTTLSLEAHLAHLTSHAAALFVLSGTMGNQLALRSHLTQPPYSILCDHRAHILEWEAGGAASLCGALVRGVVPQNGIYLTLADIQKHIVLSDDVHACPTRVISLENTLGGTIMPLAECQRIAAFARAHDVKLHLDGARLWEAIVAGAGSLVEFSECFDSVSLCFSKGLGAPVGSILVGSEKFIKHARWVRKSIGGGLRQPGVLTAAARVAVDETFGKGPNGEGGLLRRSHEVARGIAAMWTEMGGKLAKPTETNMVWFDLEDCGVSSAEFVEIGKRNGLRFLGPRLVVHYQISAEAVKRLGGALEEVLARRKEHEGTKDINGSKEKLVGQKVYGT